MPLSVYFRYSPNFVNSLSWRLAVLFVRSDQTEFVFSTLMSARERIWTPSQRADSAVSHEHVKAGIVYWSSLLLSTIITFGGSGAKLVRVDFRLREQCWSETVRSWSAATESCEESRKSTELEQRRFEREQWERHPPWRLKSKCRKHFSDFRRRKRALPRWRRSCRSNRLGRRQLNKKGARWFRFWERCDKIVAASIQRGLDNPSFWEGVQNRTSASGLTECVRSCLRGSGIRFSVL